VLNVLRTAVFVLLTSTSVTAAQTPGHARRFLPELRADATIRDGVSVAHLGGGFHVNSGTYVRLALLAGYGVAIATSESSPSYRVEVQGRFHLDPTRSSRFGLYGLGGIVSSYDDFSDWESRIVAGAGVELPAHGRATLAIEVALAGGLRISVLARRLTLGRR
jgi:hypothetical protein